MRLKILVAGVIAWLAATSAAAEPGRYRPPHHAWGAPDLEGLWTNGSQTTLERSAAFTTLIVPDVEAEAFEARHSGSPIAPDAVGQDQSEWWELGGHLGRIGGQARSSWIVDPADGKLPYTEEGRRQLQARRTASAADFDGPEARPSAERCLSSIGGASAGPLLNAGYNSNLQIVQTPDHVVISLEMNHDARIIPLTPVAASAFPSWTGNSQGHWDGDTLVVETAGFHPTLGWRQPSTLYLSPAAKITERFTRTGSAEILYSFTVEDPTIFTRPWRAEMPFRVAKGPMFEFACHEGNYSLAGALAGARAQEREAGVRASR
jgi:hypothetical protein